MEFTIAHETAYYYPEGVNESYTVLYLQPRSDQTQFCTRYELKVAPRARVLTYGDRYGNDVQHFAILPTHSALSITSHSRVVTLRPHEPPVPIDATRATLESDPAYEEMYDFLHETKYVRFSEHLAAFAAELPPLGQAIGVWCGLVSREINQRFSYDTEATSVHSDLDDSLDTRAGVCQDFAHIMIGLLRKEGIPARYASGYIFRGDSRVLGAEASHAWCEAYLPPYGWVGFDPTNDRMVNDYFVKVAIGRDYGDVSPVRGVYRGSGRSEMLVNVGMNALYSAQQ